MSENLYAFPRHPKAPLTDPHKAAEAGMTLRDYFAGQALVGIVTAMLGKAEKPEATFAFGAYEIADAMIAARSAS